MIQEWFDKRIFLYIILGICSIGVIIKFILSMKYRLLIRASKRMGTSKNRLMRVLRLKFETCYKLKIGVNNVDTFVDKYVYRYRFCGLLLYTWETISGEIIILSILSGSIFSILGLLEECGRDNILSTFIAGVLGALVLISYDHFINLNTKRKVLKVNIRDYLENFLKSRMENGEFSSELLEQYKKEYLELPGKKVEKNKGKSTGTREVVPGLVADVESAATEVTLIPSKEAKKNYKPGIEEEFDDAHLFMDHEKKMDKPALESSIEEKKEDKTKHKNRKKMKAEDEAELRRKAKKDELKRMIMEDKENRHKMMSTLFPEIDETEKKKEEESKEEQKNGEKEQESQTSFVSPFSRPDELQRASAQEETESKKEPVAEELNASMRSISNEEAQIIEDILREYLA